MKLTKQLVNKFKYPIIDIRVMNGVYKRAEAKVVYSNGWEYKITVERVHPMLENYCSCADKPEMHWPTGRNSWNVCGVPEELKWTAEKLYEYAETTEQEAVEMEKRLQDALRNYYKEMHLVMNEDSSEVYYQ